MVKIPKLAEDGQNWKIYRTKFLEVAATFDCLEVLAGRPYEGDDWDGCNALLCCTFMESVPPSIYFKICHRTVQENFKYLTKRFHDNDPIPHANKLQCTGTATVVETPEKSPTNTNAATEWHVHTEWNTEDLSTTQDVNNGNVRCTEDPCKSFEASAQGTSAKCSEMTPVVLESTPHEMQNWLQNSLLLTLRLPIEGKPSGCKQEVVDSIVTAGRTNRMVRMTKPPKPQIVNIDRTPPLGGKLAERAYGVNEGDGTKHESKSQLQQTKLLCKESHQCSGNTNRAIPDAYGLPLEGEWTVCMSGEASDSERDADTSNGLTEPLTTTIKLDDADGSGVPSMYLGGMCWHAGDMSRPEGQSDGSVCQTDGPNGQVDGSRGLVDALNVLNRAETEVIGHGEGMSTYLGPGDAKCLVLETDGTRNHWTHRIGQWMSLASRRMWIYLQTKR